LAYDIGIYLDDDEIVLLFQAIDKDNSGQISFPEFMHAWRKAGKDKLVTLLLTDRGRQAVQYFRYFDQENTGRLSTEEFILLWDDLKKYGLVDRESPEEALTILDTDNDHTIRFNEYMQYIMKMGQ